MNLYIVRHGETEANIANLVCGQMDTPLTINGIEQAKKLSNRLKLIDFDYCYTTPLQRAYRTAELVYPSGVFTQVNALMETDTGDTSNWTVEKLYEFDHRYKFHGINYDLKYPNGESIFDLFQRTIDWLNHLFKNNMGEKNILIVGHGGTVNSILHHLLSVPMRLYPAFNVKNATYAKIHCDLDKNLNRLLDFNKR